MIVKYVRERGYKGEGKDPHFEIGREYVVLGVSFNPSLNSNMLDILRDSDNYPVILELKHFDIIDDRVPPDWLFRDVGRNILDLQPREFSGDFWELFHDGNAVAEKTFNEVVNKIYAFHGKEPFFVEESKKEPLKEHEWWKEYVDDEDDKSS